MGEVTVDRVRPVDDHVEHLLSADRRDRDDRVRLFDREPREADALPPQELVLLTASLVDLRRASWKDEDRLPTADQSADVVTGAANHPARGEQVAPDRHGVVGVLAKTRIASRRCFQTYRW